MLQEVLASHVGGASEDECAAVEEHEDGAAGAPLEVRGEDAEVEAILAPHHGALVHIRILPGGSG